MRNRTSSAKCPFTKETVQASLSAAWARTIAGLDGGKAAFAKALGVHPDTVNNALCGNTVPELHTALNSLLACPTALHEVFRLYGLQLVPQKEMLCPDMRTAVEMSDALNFLLDAISDGKRDHRETIELAAKLRPLAAKFHAIIAEADEHRGLPRTSPVRVVAAA